MESLGLVQNDLSEYLGYSSRVSEVLNKKRKLTLPMIRALNETGYPAGNTCQRL
ncbi:MAG: hypothetical protein R3A12_16475 [Ignavibacteria bacterium]